MFSISSSKVSGTAIESQAVTDHGFASQFEEKRRQESALNSHPSSGVSIRVGSRSTDNMAIDLRCDDLDGGKGDIPE